MTAPSRRERDDHSAAPFKPQLSALLAALIEDLSAATPYAMAALAEYGKVSGYAEPYAELRRDVFEVLDLYERMFVEARFELARGLPALAPRRLMSEAFFERERRVLLDALARIDTELARSPSGAVESRARLLSDTDRRAVDRLMERSGLEPGVASAPPAPQATAPPQGGARIYISSRFSQPIGDQISRLVAQVGFEPIGAVQSNPPQNDDLALRQSMIETASGGIVSLVAEGADADPARFFAESAIAAGLEEIALAEQRLQSNLLIVARENMIDQLPKRVRSKPLFTVKNTVMTDYELSLFGVVAAKIPWLRR